MSAQPAPAPDPAPPSGLAWPVSWLPTSLLLILAVGVNVIGNELNRLVADVLSADGHVHTLTDVIGFAAGTQTGNWEAWSSSTTNPATFIIVATVLDIVFIGCYGIAGLRLVTVAARYWAGNGWTPPAGSPEGASPQPSGARALVLALMAADLLEDLFLILFASGLYVHDGAWWDHASWGWFVASATYLKLLALVAVVLYFIFSDTVGKRVRSFVPIALRAVYAQLISVLVVVAVGALTLLPRPDLFEQASDAFRGWLIYSPASASSAAGALSIDGRVASAIIADLFVGFMLFAITRGRVRHFAREEENFPREDVKLRWWYVAAGVLAVIAFVVAATSTWTGIDWVPLGILLGVIVVIAAVSWGLRKLPEGILPAPLAAAAGPTPSAHVKVVGDLLVAAWIAVSFFGPLKAFVSPLFLGLDGVFKNTALAGSSPLLLVIEIVLLGLGITIAVWQWKTISPSAPAPTAPADATRFVALRTFVNRVGSTNANYDNQTDHALTVLRRIIFGVGAAVILLLLVFPNIAGAGLGAVPAMTVLVGSWAAVLGTLERILGHRKPLEIFAFLRLRSTPIVALLIVVPLAVSFIDGPPRLHAIRFAAEPASAAAAAAAQTPRRPNLLEAFNDWNTRQADCTTTFTQAGKKDVSVRPLVLVAAQGGGIRAATWTVDVLQQLPGVGDCAKNSVFLSSGASGGSIGLATFRQNVGTSTKGPTKANTYSFGGPSALGTVVASILDGDLLAGVTGIRVPTQTDPGDVTSPWTWHDRTALQELSWESVAPQLAQPIDIDPVAPTGYVVFNSTDSVSTCKVLVSQIKLGATSNALTPDCTGPSDSLANTIDLRDTIGKCFFDLNWSTAAELSARFPLISPPGRISPKTVPDNCRKNLAQMQLVDGGTSDNSAISTLSDVAPELSSLITTYNAAQTGSATAPFVVPVLVYASNDPGLDLSATANRIKPDALVPLSVLQRSQAAELTPAAWLSRAANGYSQVCGTPPKVKSTCERAVTAIDRWVHGGATVVSPATQPAISVPLGWTLSDFSRDQLQLQATQQASCGRVHDGSTTQPKLSAACRADFDYGMYGDLLSLFSSDTSAVTLTYPAKTR